MTTRKIDCPACPAKQGNWVCTLDDGHTGDHEAGGVNGNIYERWPVRERQFCAKTDKGYRCTLVAGHSGGHQAEGSGGRVIHTWQQEPKPLKIKFFDYKPEEKQHSVLLTLEELKSVVYALAGEEWLEDEPELVKKFDKALKAAL